ncbi:predicted protein [Streptomyces viridochromogenes DSM 40736]|uniref:Predicted protein n=1 Tax=Streptomyces viridochromogenes (strain DSM 40736 / JCM 4977 / BCRC 1201 / Tue 494) TaxID=591159 RepID=D9X1A2_STRVT|nr:predicted protein [Streptomyces viridochromogenes DSM 40736]
MGAPGVDSEADGVGASPSEDGGDEGSDGSDGSDGEAGGVVSPAGSDGVAGGVAGGGSSSAGGGVVQFFVPPFQAAISLSLMTGRSGPLGSSPCSNPSFASSSPSKRTAPR